MLAEVPSGYWADTLVLQGGQRDGGDSVLCLESFGPLEIKEKTLFVQEECLAELAQETENQSHPEWY